MKLDSRRIMTYTAEKKSELGQFMTPLGIADFMASMFSSTAGRDVSLLDAGAGTGSLTSAFAMKSIQDGAASIRATAWEIDAGMLQSLAERLGDIAALSRYHGVQFDHRIEHGDFIDAASRFVLSGKVSGFTHAILNPPYKKIHSASAHRQFLRMVGIETGNLYSAFVALSLLLLENGGEMLAITPRSFCNGPYFRHFRQLLLKHAALCRVHVFDTRDQAFRGDDVLQETVIFHIIKGAIQSSVMISTSIDASFSDVRKWATDFSEVVMPGDAESIFHLVTDGSSEDMRPQMAAFTNTLADLGVGVATGPIVDFRLKSHLRRFVGMGCVPLVYPLHFSRGFVEHPKVGSKKANAIEDNAETAKWLLPAGHYVVTRRLSSKEEKRRIVPALFDPNRVACPGGKVGFENHLNVLHEGKRGLRPEVAQGLAVYLGSTLADKWLRRFNGHTQVNAGDLRVLRYPDRDILVKWGKRVGMVFPSQEEIDYMVEETVRAK
ncbi:MAG: Eco57I restriction-modification methylase domain-containing protein [Nitrospirae bacterium]|nr:Eco57I restriction-modification methylase domain-containing protein [Magnetococcales bacterium]HAT50043.1 SAM-dependent methyltransferase [Alphaproteobacteria bacterium]